jgi:predicted RNA binding protein with dsRBD fold (UPF0201 family)
MINPTEDPVKVRFAIENIFGSALEIKKLAEGSKIIAKSKDLGNLARLSDLLRRERIRDAARKFLLKKIRGKTITFFLNKQVAFAGHVSFCEEFAESPLGPLKIQIKTEDPLKLINWIAPPSQKRKIK